MIVNEAVSDVVTRVVLICKITRNPDLAILSGMNQLKNRYTYTGFFKYKYRNRGFLDD